MAAKESSSRGGVEKKAVSVGANTASFATVLLSWEVYCSLIDIARHLDAVTAPAVPVGLMSADLRTATSAFPPILSASPSGADLPGGAAKGPLLTQAV